MKTFKAILSVLILFSVNAFCQTWNSQVEALDIGTGETIASCVDYQGIHVLYYTSGGSLQYALLNSQGSVIRSGITIDNSIGNSASIAAYGGNVYAIYDKGGYINISRSTNAGANWTQYISSTSRPTNGTVTAMTSVADNRAVHVAWSVGNSPYAQTYYSAATYPPSPYWSRTKNVTDTGDSGGWPSIALSSSRIHIGYSWVSSGAGYCDTRDYEWDSDTWDTPLQVPYGSSYNTGGGSQTKLAVQGKHFICNIYGRTWEFDVSGGVLAACEFNYMDLYLGS
jgi:hypothetical protein